MGLTHLSQDRAGDQGACRKGNGNGLTQQARPPQRVVLGRALQCSRVSGSPMRLRKAKGRPRSSCHQATIERRNRHSCRCFVLQRLSASRLTQLTASSPFLLTVAHVSYRLRDRLRRLRRTVGVTTMAQLRESGAGEERDPHAPLRPVARIRAAGASYSRTVGD